MSASPANDNNSNDDDNEESDNSVLRRPASNNNPFLVAAVGMALLSSDPAVTLAAQSARDAVFPGAPSAPPVLVLSAATATTGDPALKELLGEVVFFFAFFFCFFLCISRPCGGGVARPSPCVSAMLNLRVMYPCMYDV